MRRRRVEWREWGRSASFETAVRHLPCYRARPHPILKPDRVSRATPTRPSHPNSRLTWRAFMLNPVFRCYGPRTPNTGMNVRYEHPVWTRCERDYRDAADGSYPNLTTARVLPCRPVRRRDDALPAGYTPSRKDGGRTACSKRCPASDIFQAVCGIVSRGPGQLVFNTEPPSTANVAGTEPREYRRPHFLHCISGQSGAD